jgi:hypothetical protein
MTVCVLCDRLLPQGGVLDGVGRPMHYVCLLLQKREVADAAHETARKIVKGHRQTPARPLMQGAA